MKIKLFEIVYTASVSLGGFIFNGRSKRNILQNQKYINHLQQI